MSDTTPAASAYYLPQPSSWPVTGASALLLTAIGAATWINRGAAGPYLLSAGAALLAFMDAKQSLEVATVLSDGRWTHDYPITVQAARAFGLTVSTDMPRGVYDLMDLYPQSGGTRPSVWYVPLRRTAPQAPAALVTAKP